MLRPAFFYADQMQDNVFTRSSCPEIVEKTSASIFFQNLYKNNFFLYKKASISAGLPSIFPSASKKERHVFPETQLYLPFSLYKK